MTEYKADKFFAAAIEKTKNGQLSWFRILGTDITHADFTDPERSFSARYGSGKIYLIRSCLSGEITCIIKPDKEADPQQLGVADNASLLRLYNIVYSLFPSVESFIDSFIGESPTE